MLLIVVVSPISAGKKMNCSRSVHPPEPVLCSNFVKGSGYVRLIATYPLTIASVVSGKGLDLPENIPTIITPLFD